MTRRTATALGVLLAVWCAGVHAGRTAAREQTPSELSAGGRLTRPLPAGEPQAISIVLAAGVCLRAAVSSTVADTEVRLLTEEGEVARELALNVRGGESNREPITFIAERAGRYRIEVRTGEKEADGEFTVDVEDIRPPTPEDRMRSAAEQSFWEALAAHGRRGEENLRAALRLYRTSLGGWSELGDEWMQGYLLNEIGWVHRVLGEHQQALDHYLRALPLLRSSGYLRGEAAALNNIANILQGRGEIRTALDYFNRSLDVVRQTGNRQTEAILLNNIGVLHQGIGEYQTALDLYYEALTLRRAVEDRRGEARTLNNLSYVYRLLGDFDSAKQAAEQALSLATPLPDRQTHAMSLNSLAAAERLLGELTAAELRLSEAVELFRALGERRMISAALNNLGELYQAQERHDRAQQAFDQALVEARAAEEAVGEALILRNLGILRSAQERRDEALEYLEASLELERRIRNRDGEAEALRWIARILRDHGRPKDALRHSDLALGAVESLRGRVVSPQLRTTYFASKRPFYELHVDLLMSAGGAPEGDAPARASAPGIAAALEASERARARSLVDLLREAGVTIREGIDPELLDREDELRLRINAVEGSRVRALSEKPAADRLSAIEQDLDAVLLEYERLQSEIRTRSPRYAAITQAEGISVLDIQTSLDPDMVLLEYMLGDERSYVWKVTTDSVDGFVLPPRAAVEAMARDLYAELARGRRGGQPGMRAGTTEALARARRRLSDALLAPVADSLAGRRIVVVADGALLYIPFALLDSPHSPAPRPLVLDHEIVHLPSVSSLLIMRRSAAEIGLADASIGVIADPVFSADDERVRRRGSRGAVPAVRSAAAPADAGAPSPGRAGAASTASAGTRGLQRSASDAGLLRFPRLRFTRQEAGGIASLAGESRVFQALDFTASRETATSERFGRHGILHFATHGLINSVHPELSGLVLSLVDSRGDAQDGFLRLHDIYNLKLDAGLVVLSACQTALGKDVRGEGLIGLTRGFMYGGAPRIVASLWDVEDRATAALMKHFYEGILVRGETPARALRQAQLALLADRRWSHPYYWGAFVLQGEWR
jgi:CHAT domain-containing protein/tetratricopeptide (TPR) repeat protein